MTLIGQTGCLLGQVASSRDQSAGGDKAHDNSFLTVSLSCTQATEEIRDLRANPCSMLHSFLPLPFTLSFAVRMPFPKWEIQHYF